MREADPRHYGCGGWKYRGLTVCRNTIKVSRAIVESVLLAAIQRDLFTEEGFTVFRQEVTRLLAARRRPTPPVSRLKQVEQEIENILAAIKQGILTPTTKAALEHAESEREQLRREERPDSVVRLLPNLRERFKTLVATLGAIPSEHVDKARR